MAEMLDWRKAEDQRELVRRAIQDLRAGLLVAFPTETVYGLAALASSPAGVERICSGKKREGGKPLTLAFAGVSPVLEWLPNMSAPGRRLAKRSWPGPLTLVFGEDVSAPGIERLPAEVRPRISPSGTLGVRVPCHSAILDAIQELGEPLVLTSANRSGRPPATTAADVLAEVGEEVALVIDDGPSQVGQASTVVEVNENSWRTLREGSLSQEDLMLRAATVILFVCTGNTCRSPMAAALCKKLLAERLGCSAAELPAYGIIVLSAGIFATMGGSAAHEAIETVRQMGADLTAHRSRPLSDSLMNLADHLIGMTTGHVQAMASYFPAAAGQVRLLSPEGVDLPDPVGGDARIYQECATKILHDVEKLIPELQLNLP